MGSQDGRLHNHRSGCCRGMLAAYPSDSYQEFGPSTKSTHREDLFDQILPEVFSFFNAVAVSSEAPGREARQDRDSRDGEQ